MARLKGTTVILYKEVQTGTNPFGAPIIEEVPIQVDNVLVGKPETDDITSSTELYGKKIEYMLGIPKGDTVKTFGFPITGIEKNIPPQLPWHMKVRCEAYG